MSTPYDNPPSTRLPAVETGICAHCHRPILETDAVDDTGTLHFEPCAGEAAAMLAEMIVDRAREREMWREWGGL